MIVRSLKLNSLLLVLFVILICCFVRNDEELQEQGFNDIVCQYCIKVNTDNKNYLRCYYFGKLFWGRYQNHLAGIQTPPRIFLEMFLSHDQSYHYLSVVIKPT